MNTRREEQTLYLKSSNGFRFDQNQDASGAQEAVEEGRHRPSLTEKPAVGSSTGGTCTLQCIGTTAVGAELGLTPLQQQPAASAATGCSHGHS
ncbi:hypothetical protein H920_07618 [Fukomys damarensis]|uniref:Uncharacterized protein n=1 Tax=Fukomys damarensis TaxID=885580 RepID=A0A091DL11_FUKDA|nr:hypothetical protein H920_07618 [Fukomys damarensis]